MPSSIGGLVEAKERRPGSRLVRALTLSAAFVAAVPCAGLGQREGGGVSTERYVNKVFDFAMSYPAAWHLVEGGGGGSPDSNARRAPASTSSEGARTEADACARLAMRPDSCRSVRIRNGESPESWVEAVFVVDGSVGDLGALETLARRYHPGSRGWERLGENAYAEGWTATKAGNADGRSEGFANAYLASPGLAVLLRGRAYEKGDGVLGVRLVKESVARASRGPRLLGVRVGSPSVRVGEEICYLLDVQDVAGAFTPGTVHQFKLAGDLTPSVPRTVAVASTRRGSEATLRVCTRVSPRYRKDGVRIDSLGLESSSSGQTTWCTPNEEGTTLTCAESAWNVAGPSPARTVALPRAIVEDARADTHGPRIDALTFDPGHRVIRVRASDGSGLGLAQLFVAEDDGVTRLASDWKGVGGGFELWPADTGASTQGELEIPVRSFRTRGGVLLLGGVLRDTVGNQTTFAFDPRKDKAHYVCRADGSKGCGSKLPILNWLEAGIDP